MVLMNAGKAARNQASIMNRPNCGGNKKGGLGPRVGWFLSSNPSMVGAPNVTMKICRPNRTTQVQRYGYRATLGP
jgi:hypothetical protein